MPTQVQLKNRATGRPIRAQANAAGDALVAAGDSEFVEVNRHGTGFIVRSTTATAPVKTLQTTIAGLGVYNSEPDGGKSIVIDALFAVQITVGTNFTQNGIVYVLGQTRVAPFTSLLDTADHCSEIAVKYRGKRFSTFLADSRKLFRHCSETGCIGKGDYRRKLPCQFTFLYPGKDISRQERCCLFNCFHPNVLETD